MCSLKVYAMNLTVWIGEGVIVVGISEGLIHRFKREW